MLVPSLAVSLCKTRVSLPASLVPRLGPPPAWVCSPVRPQYSSSGPAAPAQCARILRWNPRRLLVLLLHGQALFSAKLPRPLLPLRPLRRSLPPPGLLPLLAPSGQIPRSARAGNPQPCAFRRHLPTAGAASFSKRRRIPGKGQPLPVTDQSPHRASGRSSLPRDAQSRPNAATPPALQSLSPCELRGIAC